MKTKNQMKPLARLIATSLAVGSMAGFGTQVLAQTAAGTLIKNLATVTYEDANGNEYSAQSNEAVVTVAPVYSAVIEKDNALSAAPGQTVYFPHVLSNTGNITDTYTLATSGTTAGSTVTVFNDLNANGQPDPGEPELSSIEVGAGEQKNIVVAMAVPVDALNAATYSTILSASTPNTTVLDENGTNDESNVDIATVSTGPVLVLNKSSVHNVNTQQITYTLTVKNNGGSDATDVSINDILPLVDHDGDDSTDAMQVTLVSVDSTSGLVNVGDEPGAAGLVVDVDDIDGDGDTTEEFNGIVAKDVILPPNTTISVTYTVSYASDPEWAAGESIDNTFTASSIEVIDPVSSNTTHDIIPTIYGVLATDTNVAGGVDPDTGASLNDGGDDDVTIDGVSNDTQYVDVSPTGGEVLFKHEITNTGNGDDVFNLSVASDDFPPNTVFTFWDPTGAVQLTDTDDDGVPDTGTIGAGDMLTIMVKAKLPAGVSGSDFTANLTATSSGNPTVKDITKLELGEITAPKLDIANAVADQGLTGFNDAGLDNAQNESPVKSINAEIGGVAVFDLKLANESGSADSYLLSASNVPTGWEVKFKDSSGNIITTTPLIPGGEVFDYKAEVTISSDPSEARHDSDRVGDLDGYDTTKAATPTNDLIVGTIDPATQDLDKDYLINFSATSTSTSSLTDTVTNSVDVVPDREVVITPNGQNQIQPGGTVDYIHKIENNGNMDESVEVAVSNTLEDDGWTTVIKVDTTGNGIPDAVLVPGTDTIKGVKPDGTYVDIDVIYVGENAQMVIPPGVDIPLISVVNSPSNAPLGTVDTSVISVSDNTGEPNPSPTVTAQDQTSVILGQVRLDKQAAIDADCDGVPEIVAPSTVLYSAGQVGQVKPDGCVIWRLTATNEGNAIVQNVVISDAAPDYTTLQTATNSLKLCLGNGADCALEPLDNTDSVPYADHATADGVVTFTPGNTTVINDVTFNDYLEPGEKLTAEFTVKID